VTVSEDHAEQTKGLLRRELVGGLTEDVSDTAADVEGAVNPSDSDHGPSEGTCDAAHCTATVAVAGTSGGGHCCCDACAYSCWGIGDSDKDADPPKTSTDTVKTCGKCTKSSAGGTAQCYPGAEGYHQSWHFQRRKGIIVKQVKNIQRAKSRLVKQFRETRRARRDLRNRGETPDDNGEFLKNQAHCTVEHLHGCVHHTDVKPRRHDEENRPTLHVVVSTAAYTPKPVADQPRGEMVMFKGERVENSGKSIMTYVREKAKGQFNLVYGYDWSGSKTGSATTGSNILDKDVDWKSATSVKNSFWFHGFKMAFYGEMKVLRLLSIFGDIDLIGIIPGEANTITMLEQNWFPLLVEEIKADLKQQGMLRWNKISFRQQTFEEFQEEFP
jgi:hypothetical protein